MKRIFTFAFMTLFALFIGQNTSAYASDAHEITDFLGYYYLDVDDSVFEEYDFANPEVMELYFDENGNLERYSGMYYSTQGTTYYYPYNSYEISGDILTCHYSVVTSYYGTSEAQPGGTHTYIITQNGNLVEDNHTWFRSNRSVNNAGQASEASAENTVYGDASPDALSLDAKIEYIRDWYYDTQDSLSSLSVLDRGNGQTAYYDGEDCVRVTLQPGSLDPNLYPGADRLTCEYYYHNGLLYFAFFHYYEEEYRYYVEYQNGSLYCLRYIDADGISWDQSEQTLLSDIRAETAALCSAGEEF